MFCTPEDTLKAVRKIVTDTKGVDEPKDAESSSVYKLYRYFASPAESQDLKQLLEKGGIGWGKAKEALAEKINSALREYRVRYTALIANPQQIRARLDRDAAAAREIAQPILKKVKVVIGIRR